jgi:hypothetical protein
MIHTFDSIIQEVMRQTDEAGDTDTTLTLVKEYVRAAHNRRCVEFREFFMKMRDTLTTVVDQREYTLSPLFDKPIHFYNEATKELLEEIPPRSAEVELDLLNPTTQGTAGDFYFSGYAQTKNQPTSASVVTVVSNNGSDTGSTYQVAVKGINTSGDIVVDVLTPNGTTPAAGSLQFREVLAITKAGATNGTLTFTSNSGAVTLLTLSPNELGKQYRKIYLVNLPTAAETISYTFYRKPIYLVNNYDVPDIPYPYSQVLVYDALLMFATYNTDMQSEARIVMWQQEQQNWENALRGFSKDGQTVGGRARYTRDTFQEFDAF